MKEEEEEEEVQEEEAEEGKTRRGKEGGRRANETQSGEQRPKRCVYVSFYVKLMTICWPFDADELSLLKTAAGSLSP